MLEVAPIMSDGRVDRDATHPTFETVELRELGQILELLHPTLLGNVGRSLSAVGIPQRGGKHLACKSPVQSCLGAPLFCDAPFQQIF